MGRGIRASIRAERNMAMGSICGGMVVSLMAIGRIIRLLDMESIIGMMVGSMRAIGWRIRCMDRACICGLMEGSMREIMLMIKKKDMESIPIQMVDVIKDNGKILNSMEKEYLLIQKGIKERVNGLMEREVIGLMR